MVSVEGLESFSEVISYFFTVLNQFVNLLFSNWFLMIIPLLLFFSLTFDLIDILKGKK